MTVPADAGPSAPSAQSRVVLYGRTPCGLCDEARSIVSMVCTDAGVDWVEVNIDAPGADPALAAKYGNYVPVVTVDDVQIGFWTIDPARLVRAIGESARRR